VKASLEFDKHRLSSSRDYKKFMISADKWLKLAKTFYMRKEKKYGRGNVQFACLIKRAKKKISCE
jgi:hypothetical protein